MCTCRESSEDGPTSDRLVDQVLLRFSSLRLSRTWEFECELCSVAWAEAAYSDSSSVRFDQCSGDRQANSATACVSTSGGIGLVEAVEEMV